MMTHHPERCVLGAVPGVSFKLNNSVLHLPSEFKYQTFCIGKLTRLGRCFLDWATAVAGEGDTCQLSVSFTCHGIAWPNLENIGPI